MDWVITIAYALNKLDSTEEKRRRVKDNLLKKFATWGFHQLEIFEVFSGVPERVEVYMTKRLDAKSAKEMAQFEEYGEKVCKLIKESLWDYHRDFEIIVHTTIMKVTSEIKVFDFK